MSCYLEVCKIRLENALERICWYFRATWGLLWKAVLQHKKQVAPSLLCKTAVFSRSYPGAQGNWLLQSLLPSSFYTFAEWVNKEKSLWNCGSLALSRVSALTWKFVFLAQVVWCNMDRSCFLLSSSLSLLLAAGMFSPISFHPSPVACSDRQHKGRDGESGLISSCVYGGPLPWS